MHDEAARMREFNRFYTQLVGGLEGKYLGSRWRLAEARVLFEVGLLGLETGKGRRAQELGETLGMDAGYLSRILRRLESDGLLRRLVEKEDRRAKRVVLSKRGEAELAQLNDRAQKQMEGLLGKLGAKERRELLECMRRIQELLG